MNEQSSVIKSNSMPRRVSITTLGCKSNQYDSSAIEDILRMNNFEICSPEGADICIINTCTVTGKTDYQSRQLIRKAVNANPNAIVMVTGCYAQVSGREIAQISGVDYVLGNTEKEKVIEYILQGKKSRPEIHVSNADKDTPMNLRAKGSSGRTRAYLKVQDGCNNSCSYCIIPRARGISRSLPTDAVLKEIDNLVESGYREIILTGIHLGGYGLDLNRRTDITELVRAIENRKFPARFRISSLDPDEVTDALIEILADSGTFCNHLHLPLQSGDEEILKLMNRRHTAVMFEEIIQKIVKTIPDVSIGIDVIAGFPGEGENEFSRTYEFLERLPVSYMHVFPFSKRKGTPAAGLLAQVGAAFVKERCEALRQLDKAKRKIFYERFIGRKASVLIESSRDRDTGLSFGRTRNYIPFFVKDYTGVDNVEVDVEGSGIYKDGIAGNVVYR